MISFKYSRNSQFDIQKIILLYCVFLLTSCEKMLEIAPPYDTISDSQAFSDSAGAVTTIRGLYNSIGNGNDGFWGDGGATVSLGLYTDELQQDASETGTNPFYFSNLTSSLPFLRSSVWGKHYNYIYQSNYIIENTTVAPLSASLKSTIIAEAKFIRALSYFYLVNIFGEVPLVTVSDYHQNISISRSSVAAIYDFIVEDLQNAKSSLREDFAISLNERVRANSYSAAALLSKVYLHLGEYEKALAECNYILENTSSFSLMSDPAKAFDKNCSEAILQFHANTAFFPFNVTGEGMQFVATPSSPARYFLPQEFINLFQPGDKRWAWIDSTTYLGVKQYYPRKYHLGSADLQPNGDVPQFVTLFRLPEILLIRAECYLQRDQLIDAMNDINILRDRAGIQLIENADKEMLRDELLKERRMELFCEFGHRWFDLKRLGKADEINSAIKPGWQPHKKLWPLPSMELQRNGALIQNPGYQ